MIVASLDPVRIRGGELWVDRGRVAATGEGERIDGDGVLVVPGNVCAHTHLYAALARGLPAPAEPPRSFVQALRHVWWRLDRALDEESVRASALVGGLEALLSGTTTLVDHHASPNAADGSLDLIEEALRTLGVRSVLCYEVSDRDGPARARAGLRENERFLERAGRGQLPLARALVGAHAPFTLADETLVQCAELARTFDVGVHVHAGEDPVDSHAVVRLEAAGALDGRTVLAHGVHLSGTELVLLRDEAALLVHNARSNMNNGVGRARVGFPRLRVALGTDGIGGDLFEESRTAYLRLREEDRAVGPHWALARLAEGARAVGRMFGEPLLGTLEPGAPADLLVLDYPAPAPLDDDSLGAHWIFGLGAGHVRDVMVAGEWVVRDRRSTRIDRDELAATARESAAGLRHRLAEVGPHHFEPKGGRRWPSLLETG